MVATSVARTIGTISARMGHNHVCGVRGSAIREWFQDVSSINGLTWLASKNSTGLAGQHAVSSGPSKLCSLGQHHQND